MATPDQLIEYDHETQRPWALCESREDGYFRTQTRFFCKKFPIYLCAKKRNDEKRPYCFNAWNRDAVLIPRKYEQRSSAKPQSANPPSAANSAPSNPAPPTSAESMEEERSGSRFASRASPAGFGEGESASSDNVSVTVAVQRARAGGEQKCRVVCGCECTKFFK